MPSLYGGLEIISTSYVTYDDWGALTAKAIVKMGVRELDLVQEYTGHPYDMVLGIYFAEARMYDASDRRFMAMYWVKGEATHIISLTQYLYVISNPLRWFDPDGRYRSGYYKGVWYEDADKAEFGEDSYVYKSITELSTFYSNMQGIIASDDLLMVGPAEDTLPRVSKLADEIRRIGRADPGLPDKIVAAGLNALGKFSSTEIVIYSYYNILFCASMESQRTARQVGKAFYEDAQQAWNKKGIHDGGYVDRTNGNAFVHSLWNALTYTSLVRDYGYSKEEAELMTWLATAAHEYNNSAVKEAFHFTNIHMDMFNNEMGVKVAASLIGDPTEYISFEERMDGIIMTLINEIDSGNLVRSSIIDKTSDPHKVTAIYGEGEKAYELYQTSSSERKKTIGQMKSWIRAQYGWIY